MTFKGVIFNGRAMAEVANNIELSKKRKEKISRIFLEYMEKGEKKSDLVWGVGDQAAMGGYHSLEQRRGQVSAFKNQRELE